MFTRRHLRALAGTLLMVPLLAFTACEGYEEPGDQMDQEQAGEQPPVQGERPSDVQQDDPATAGDPGGEETQRREAERPDRPAPPTTTEGADERTPEAGDAERDAGAATAGSAAATAASTAMTELSVELPPDLSAGSYAMTCRMQDQPDRQAAGQPETDQDVRLSITVAESGASGASATERPGASQPGQPGESQPGEDTAETGDTP